MTQLTETSEVQNIPKTKIYIPKGTLFRTCHPQKEGEQFTKRAMIVESPTFIRKEEENYTWAGTGGYWCWTKKTNVFYA